MPIMEDMTMPHEAQQDSRRHAVLARLILLSSWLLLSVAALGADPQVDALTLLESKNYAALERHYAARQKSYEDGAIVEETLYDDFRALYKDSAANEQYFDGWVSAFP